MPSFKCILLAETNYSYSLTTLPTQRAHPYHAMLPDGIFVVGQEMDGVEQQAFDEVQALDGFLDEVRLWSKTRTGAEIRGTYNRSIAHDTPGLLAYLDFDSRATTIPTPVLGNVNLGRTGGVRNTLKYGTNKGIGHRLGLLPSVPSFVPSRAPVIGSGLSVARLVH